MNYYKATVNKTETFDLNDSSIENLDAIAIEESVYHVLKEHKSHKVHITESDFLAKKYTVKVNGNTYEVDIASALDQLIKEMGFEVGATKQVNAIKAPMPGLVLEISVTAGQEVQEGDNLLILEAMKMENPVRAHRAGTITGLAVEAGSGVGKGDVLVEIT